MENARTASEALFKGDIALLKVSLLKEMASDVPSITITPQELATGMTLVDLLVHRSVFVQSRCPPATRPKGVRVNGKPPAEGDNPSVGMADFLEGEVLVLQRGKRNNYLVLLGAGVMPSICASQRYAHSNPARRISQFFWSPLRYALLLRHDKYRFESSIQGMILWSIA